MSKTIVFYSPRPPLWRIAIASLAYTLLLFLIAEEFFDLRIFSQIGVLLFAHNLKLYFSLFAIGIYFSLHLEWHFNLKEELYKKVYRVGFIKYGKWQHLPEVSYLSLFYLPKQDLVEVKYWYEGNRHLVLATVDFEEDALDFALQMAKSLQTELLDARDPHNSKWVEVK